MPNRKGILLKSLPRVTLGRFRLVLCIRRCAVLMPTITGAESLELKWVHVTMSTATNSDDVDEDGSVDGDKDDHDDNDLAAPTTN